MSPQLRLHDSNLPEYLQNLGIVPAGKELSVEPAGDGNINWVRRARCRPEGPSWVVKQARPALERFPEYRVSTRRILVEARYYERVGPLDPERATPGVVHFDAEARVLVLEDLGDALRLDAALARGMDVRPVAERMAGLLGAVHAATRDTDLADFANDEMQRLHGDHIFRLPYRENDFPLSAARRPWAESIWRDAELVATLDAAHARYLETREVLVHGDVQSANILWPPGRPVLLDAEIAHAGDAAFDLGVLAAHLLMPAVARAAPADALPALEALRRGYAGSGASVEVDALARYAGAEMARRTLGAARVPWVESDAGAERVLACGVALIRRAPASWPELERLLATEACGKLG